MTTYKAPGKHYRRGVSLIEIMDLFPDDRTAEDWFVSIRWPDGKTCPFCESKDVAERASRKPMPYRCRSCKRYFSVKHGTVMESSKLGCRKWAIAIYLLTTGLKGTASMKLHRDLKVTQKTAWHMAHRIRETFAQASLPFDGPAESDEMFVGGLERNKHESKRNRGAGHHSGKTVLAGMKDRSTNQMSVAVVPDTGPSLRRFVRERVKRGATLYTDEAGGYKSLRHEYEHQAVHHSVGTTCAGRPARTVWSRSGRCSPEG